MLLDADMIVLHNIDHLFSAVRDMFAAPIAYWISPNFLCSCLIVMKPTETLFDDVLERFDGKYREDMDYFNLRYGARTKRLDPVYAALIGEWYPRDRIYHHLQRNVSVVHFIAEWKPFSFTDWHVGLDEFGVQVYARWWKYARGLHCSKSAHSAFLHRPHGVKKLA
jgi:lipopolysaccharide biosynthesis glycosyltransferase